MYPGSTWTTGLVIDIAGGGVQGTKFLGEGAQCRQGVCTLSVIYLRGQRA